MTVPNPIRPTAENAERILHFWFEETKPHQWFRRSKAFDRSIRTRFGALYEAAKAGRLDVWRKHPRHCLALIILLDQFSRNLYRGDARAFAQDAQALDVAREAIRRRFDALFDAKERAFFYMPFMHSEDPKVQEECVRLFRAQLPDTDNLPFAVEHRDIVRRFGRFPHRNKLLGRASTPEELQFLAHGGFSA